MEKVNDTYNELVQTMNDTLHHPTLNISSQCRSGVHDSQQFSMVMEGILSVIIGIFGLIGNTASVVALSRRDFKQPIHKLILLMALADSCFIITALPILLIRGHQLHLVPTFAKIIAYIFPIVFPASKFCFCFSIWIRVSIAIEQFLGIAFALYVRTRSKRMTLILYFLPCILLSLIHTFSSVIFKSKMFIPLNNTNEETNKTIYIAYNGEVLAWTNVIFTTIIPLSLFIICFVGCIISLFYAQMKRTAQFPSMAGNRPNLLSSQVFWTIFVIVLSFIICHSVRFVMTFYHVSVIERSKKCFLEGKPSANPQWLYYASIVNHFLLFINSSSNYLIYCLLGGKVRTQIVKMFGLRRNASIMTNASFNMTTMHIQQGRSFLEHSAHSQNTACNRSVSADPAPDTGMSGMPLPLHSAFSEMRNMAFSVIEMTQSQGAARTVLDKVTSVKNRDTHLHPNWVATYNVKLDKCTIGQHDSL